MLRLRESLLTVTVYKKMEQSVFFGGGPCKFYILCKILFVPGKYLEKPKEILAFLHVFLNINSVFCSGGIMMSDDNNNITNNCNYFYSTATYRISTGSGGVTLIRQHL